MIISNARIGEQLKTIVMENGKIVSVTDESLVGDIDARGKRVIPGLIDIHTHGMLGYDTMNADFEALCRFYASRGTTSVLPTTMTVSYDRLERATAMKTAYGSRVLTTHMVLTTAG